MSSHIDNLSPTCMSWGRGFNNFIFNKNWLESVLSRSILTAVTFILSPKLKLKSLKYVEFWTACIKTLELFSNSLLEKVVLNFNSVFVDEISFILNTLSPQVH